MTTLNHYEGVNDILRRLDAVEVHRRALSLLSGLAAMAALVTGGLLVAAASAGYWPNQPPVVLRWMLLAALCLVWAAGLVVFILPGLSGRRNPAQIARFIEQAMPEMRNDLISSVLLARDAAQASPVLVQQVIREALRGVRREDLRRSVSRRPLARRLAVALVCGALLATFVWFQGAAFRRGLLAVISPGGFVPVLGTVELVDLTPGDARVFVGESVTVTARVRNDAGQKLTGQMIFDGADAPKNMLSAGGHSTFTLPFGDFLIIR